MKNVIATPVLLVLALANSCASVRSKDSATNDALLAKVEVIPLKPLPGPHGPPAVKGRRSFPACTYRFRIWCVEGPRSPSDHSYRVCTRFLEIDLERVSKADVNWRYRTHTGRVSDIMQYAILTPNQADELTRKGLLPARLSSGSKLVEGQLVCHIDLTNYPFVADYTLEGGPGHFMARPVIQDTIIGKSVSVRVLANTDGSFLLDAEVAYAPRQPLGRKNPIRNAAEPRVLRVGFGPGAAAFKVEQPVVQPVKFRCQFALRSNETLLLTRDDMASRNPRTGREQQAFVTVTINQGNGPRPAAR